MVILFASSWIPRPSSASGVAGNPEHYADELLDIVEEYDFYNESQGSRLAERLDDCVEELLKQNVLALHRAMLLACLMAHDRSNDSSGDIGIVFSGVIGRYSALG